MHLQYVLISVIIFVAYRPAAAELPKNYETLSAADKQALLWKNVAAYPYENELPTEDTDFTLTFKPEFDTPAFTWTGDEMQPNRVKALHAHGSVAKVILKIFLNSSYTGIFLPGGKLGIARFSLAMQDRSNNIPGMALKILINGKPSINIIAMHSVNGQGVNNNFFANNFSNFIPPVKGELLELQAKVFREALKSLPGGQCDRPEDETKLPLLKPASIDTIGKIVDKPKAPLIIKFIPNPAVGWNANSPDDLRINLGKIPANSILYTMAVKASETVREEIIGQLILTSQFIASQYGDETLFFQHHAKRC